MEGGTGQPGVGRGESEGELERASVSNLCEVRGAEPTVAFKKDWKEEGIEGERMEAAGRRVGWSLVNDFQDQAAGN